MRSGPVGQDGCNEAFYGQPVSGPDRAVEIESFRVVNLAHQDIPWKVLQFDVVAHVRRDGPGQGSGEHGRGDQTFGAPVVEVKRVVVTDGGGVVGGPAPVDIDPVRSQPGACKFGVQFHGFSSTDR